MSDKLWYAYEAIDAGKPVLKVIGPVSKKNPRADGMKWEDSYLTQGPLSNEPMLFNYVTSFDHEPSDSEQFYLIAEELRPAYLEAKTQELIDMQTDEYNSESTPILELSGEELAAMSLAFQFRIRQLEEIVDRYVVLGSITGERDGEIIRACREQIEAIISTAEKFELDEVSWPIPSDERERGEDG